MSLLVWVVECVADMEGVAHVLCYCQSVCEEKNPINVSLQGLRLLSEVNVLPRIRWSLVVAQAGVSSVAEQKVVRSS